MNKKIKNFNRLAVLLTGALFVVGSVFAFSAPVSAQSGQGYTFEFPDYGSWGKKIVSWGDTYHYNQGGRSWNEVTVNLPQSGNYDVYTYFRADGDSSQTHEEYKILVDGNYLGQTTDSNTASTYENDYIGERYFSSGSHIVRAEHRWNFSDWNSPESVSPINVNFVLKGNSQPELSISKTVNRTSAQPNDTLTYSISYQNNGQGEADNVILTDDYDENYLLITDSQGGAISNGQITWNIGNLVSGQNGVKTFTARVKETSQSNFYIYNRATINSDQTNSQESNRVQTFINNNNTSNPPVADAGPDRQVYAGESIPLLGSGYDPDGYAVTYSWTCDGGNLDNDQIVQPLFTAPSVNSNSYYNCVLTVTDNEGLTDSDQAQILVKTRPIENAALEIDKEVRDLSRGDTGWNKSIYVSPSDVVEFRISVTSRSNTVLQNIMMKDTLPYQLTYQNGLKVDGIQRNENPVTQTINIGDLNAGQTKVITFRAMLARAKTFAYGTTELTNTVLVYNTDVSNTDICKVIVKKTSVKGATTISTGITNNFFLDSLLFPLLLSLLLVWLFRSRLVGLDRAMEQKRNNILEYRAKKKLRRISHSKDKLL